jgi:hypothetical protein
MLKITYDGVDYSVGQNRYDYKDMASMLMDLKFVEVEYYKPIKDLYLNIKLAATNSLLKVYYYDGAAWVAVSNLFDGTFGLSEPGFVSWDNVKTTQTSYRYRFNITDLASVEYLVAVPVTFRGIDLVFSDDEDLKGEYPTILDHLPTNSTTFIKFHEAARNELITELRNTGIYVDNDPIYSNKKQIDQWDVLDFSEVREAAKFLALAKIFNYLSDSPDDKWQMLASKFEASAGESLTPLISVDSNDNGIQDEGEELQPMLIKVGRL